MSRLGAYFVFNHFRLRQPDYYNLISVVSVNATFGLAF